GPEGYSELPEQFARSVARRRSEELERLGLWRDERELDVLDAAASEVGCGVKRQLVCGQGPHRAPGNDERHRTYVPACDLLEQVFDELDVRWAAERQSAGDGRKRQRAARHEQHVVGDLGVLLRVGDMSPLVDAGQTSEREARSDLTCQSVELEAHDFADLERRSDGERLVPEVR